MHVDDTIGLERAELEALFTRLERPLYNVALRWLWNRDDAADVVQDAFVRLWNARTRVQRATVDAYLYRIVINLASNRRRQHKFRQLFSWGLPNAESADPYDDLNDKQTTAFVQNAIDALPEAQRRVVVLCELAELSYAQVAEILSIPCGTVASRRHVALAKLKTALASMLEVDDVTRP